MPKCNWCGSGNGRNYTRDRKTDECYYYYCGKCVFKVILALEAAKELKEGEEQS